MHYAYVLNVVLVVLGLVFPRVLIVCFPVFDFVVFGYFGCFVCFCIVLGVCGLCFVLLADYGFVVGYLFLINVCRWLYCGLLGGVIIVFRFKCVVFVVVY